VTCAATANRPAINVIVIVTVIAARPKRDAMAFIINLRRKF
jgi:hypothetical protein